MFSSGEDMGLSDRVGTTAEASRDSSRVGEQRAEGESHAADTGIFRAQARRSEAPVTDTWTRPVAAQARSSLAPPSLSRRFWGLAWSKHLPRVVGRNGTTLEVGDWSRVRGFLERTQPDLRETNHSVLQLSAQAAKQRYFREHCDLLEFRYEEQTIGAFIGAPEDWSTYYCRLIAIDPAHNLRHFIRGFAKEALCPILAEVGVERLVGETSPSNLLMQRLFNDLGFHPTGQHLTDRWGTLIRFTKFLDDNAAKSFRDRYASGG